MKIDKDNFFIIKIYEYLIYFKYILVGGSTTLVSLTTYITLTKIFNINISIANAIGWLISIHFAFFANKLFVFESNSFKSNIIIKEYIVFISGRSATGIIGIVAFPIFILMGFDQEIFGIEGLIAKFLIGIGITVGNFIISRFLVFKKEMK